MIQEGGFMTKKLCFIISVLFVGVLYAADATNDKPYKLTIMHVSDTHGRVLDFDGKSGMASPLGVLVNSVREDVHKSKDGGYVLFLHSGDLNTGVPESDMLNAKPDIKVLSILGLDGMALGNHEFDKPLKVLKEQQKQAHFPFISSNIAYKHPKEGSSIPYIVENIDGHNICIFALLTDDKTVFSGKTLKSIDIKDPYEAAKEFVKKFPKGCFIIALSHLGISLTAKDTGDFKLASEVPEINIILGGHSHTELRKPIEYKDTLIVHSGSYAKGLSRVDLEIDSEGIDDYDYSYLRTDKIDDELAKKELPEIKETLAAALKMTSKYFDKKVGTNSSNLFPTGMYEKEVALGNLVTDAVMTSGKCDAAIAGPGGIRSGINKGDILIRDLYKTYPFDNKIVRVPVTADKLVEILKEGFFNQARKDKKPFLQVAGIKILVRDGEVVLKEIKGRAPIEGKKYTLCSDDFLTGGGDGMNLLKDVPNKVNTNINVRDGLIAYVKNKKNLDYKTEERIITTTPLETK
jgi:5'-nucleotidase/UDP-sugar diphosphatase